MNYYDYPATAIIGSDGVVTGVNDIWHTAASANPADVFLQSSVDDNYFDNLVLAAESHNVFAVKVLEGIESVLTEEFDSFEMNYFAQNGSSECRFRINISPVNGLPDKLVVCRRLLD
ncbi:MAG: hypothetical protein H8E46_05155 [FCB group bacterium]|nr:hypothetical protein [FCB group bacterium]